MITLNSLSKIYRTDEIETVALENVNLTVERGEFLSIMGPSGCGKTLASYVIAGELNKLMIVINLGAIVSSKLGETSKNLSKIFYCLIRHK